MVNKNQNKKQSKNIKKIGILGLPFMNELKPNVNQDIIQKGFTEAEADELLSRMSFYSSCCREFVEEHGVEVVNFPYDTDEGELVRAMDDLDGFLLTGGETLWEYKETEIDGKLYYQADKEAPQAYLRKIGKILEKTKTINDKGSHFPLFCICLSFQAIVLIESSLSIPIAFVDNNDNNMSIKLTDNESKFKMVFTDKEKYDLENKDLIYFYHDFGFTVEHFKANDNLTQNYTLSSTFNHSEYGYIVASIESKKYPIQAIQFHIEKNMFDYNSFFNIVHSEEVFAIGKAIGSLAIPKNRREEDKKEIQTKVPNIVKRIKKSSASFDIFGPDERVFHL